MLDILLEVYFYQIELFLDVREVGSLFWDLVQTVVHQLEESLEENVSLRQTHFESAVLVEPNVPNYLLLREVFPGNSLVKNLPQNHSVGVDVALFRVDLLSEHLGRKPVRNPLNLLLLFYSGLNLGKAEVTDFDALEVLVQEDV